MMSRFKECNDVDECSQYSSSQLLLSNNKTLDLFGSIDGRMNNSSFLNTKLQSDPLDAHAPLPLGWEKCLDLKTGEVYYTNYFSRERTLKLPSSFENDISTIFEKSNFNLESKSTSLLLDPLERQYQHDFNHFQANINPTLSLAIGSASINPTSSTLTTRKKQKTSHSSIHETNLEINLNLPTSIHSIINRNESVNQYTSMDDRKLFSSTLKKNEGVEHVLCNTNDENESHSDNNMLVLSCPSCLMYVMLWRRKPKCPNCGSYLNDTDMTNSSMTSSIGEDHIELKINLCHKK